MRLRLRLRLGGGGDAALAASISGLTVNVTHGETAQNGVEVTGILTGLVGGETVVHRWFADGVQIGGATAATFTPNIGTNVADLDALTYRPTVDGQEVISAAYTVRRVPPAFTVQPTLDSSTYNVGDTVTLTEGTASNSATLSISTFTLSGVDKSGEISMLTWDSTGESAGSIEYQVTASNSGGSVLSNMIAATLSAADTTAPSVTNAAVNTVPDPDELTFNVDEDGDLYYLVNQSATALAGATIEAGGGDLSGGPFSVVSGAVTQNVDTSSLTASTTYQMHFTVKDAAGNYSTDTVVEFTTPAAAANFSVTQTDLQTRFGSEVLPLTVSIGAADANRTILMLVGHSASSAQDFSLGGNAMTRLSNNIAASGHSVAAYTLDVSTGTTASLTTTSGLTGDAAFRIIRIIDGTVGTPVSNQQGAGGQLNLDLNTSVDQVLAGFAFGRDEQFAGAGGSTWTGATETAEAILSSNSHGYAATLDTVSTAETPRQVRGDGAQDPTAQRWSGILVPVTETV